MQGRAKVTRVGRARRWAGILGLGGALAILAALLVGLSLRASSRSVSKRALDEPVELHPAGDYTHAAGFPMPGHHANLPGGGHGQPAEAFFRPPVSSGSRPHPAGR